jgi:DNA invertase Pin-like site-specific DNA recombinase
LIESLGYPYSTEYIEEAAAYVRVSHTEQKLHGLSLEAQEEKLTEYAKNHNLKIVEWYKDEGISARKPIPKRPEMQRMIHDAEKGRFKRIIFIKLDRYFRSLSEYHACQKVLDNAGVTWTATEEKYDLSTANGRAFVNMKLTIAELEADTGGERVKIVNEYKVKSGMPLFGAQSFPFCYTVSDPEDGERHKYVVKRDEEIMEDLLAWFMVNQSIRGAMNYINKKYNRSFGYLAIRRALTNEMICGSYKGNPNYCKPYVTREMFDKIQTMVKRNPRTSGAEHAYIFTGLIRCPQCGTRLGSAIHSNRNGKSSYGYRCRRNQKEKKCDFGTLVFETTIEKKVLASIEGIVEAQEIKSIEIKANTERVSKYDVKELQAELDRLNYSWQKGRIKSVEEYDEKYDKLVAQIEAANNEIAEISETPDYEKIKTVLTAGWQEIYKELDNEHKRAFWRAFVDEIIIDWAKENKEVKDIIFF